MNTSLTDPEPAPLAINHGPALASYLNRITHADCVQELRKLPDESVDFVLTDPPYLVNYRDRTGRSFANDTHSRWVFPAYAEIYRVLKPAAFCVSFYGWCKVEKFLAAWRECGFRLVGHFTWVKDYASRVGYTEMRHESAFLLAKGRPGPVARPARDVLPYAYTGNRHHPTQKPISALTPLIEAYSRPGDIILDPFGDSGTTGLAAHRCHRRFILMEKERRYYEAATARLARALNPES